MQPTPCLDFILVGAESLTIQCGERLRAGGHRVVRVVSSAPAVVAWAERSEIPAVANAKGLLADPVPCDYLLSVANLKVLPPEALALARREAINFHDGPLPRYAGLYTPAWALINQEPTHGITWHLMTSEIDAGDILAQRVFDLSEHETSLTLNTRCYEAAIETFEEVVEQLASDSLKRTPQTPLQDEYYARDRRPRAAAELDWRRPAAELSALVRGLDFGSYPNPLALPKAVLADDVVVIRQMEVLPARSTAEPGTITAADGAWVVATGDHDVKLAQLETVSGQAISMASAPAAARFTLPTESRAERVSELNQQVCTHEAYWTERLARPQPLEIPLSRTSAHAPALASQSLSLEGLDLPASGAERADAVLGLHAAYLARLCASDDFDVAYTDESLAAHTKGLTGWFAGTVPLRFSLPSKRDAASVASHINKRLAGVRRRLTYAQDLRSRDPELRAAPATALPVAFRICADIDAPIDADAALTISVSGDGASVRWSYDEHRFDASAIERMQVGLRALAASIAAEPTVALRAHSILSAEEQAQLLGSWNETTLDYPHQECLHTLFMQQVVRTPEQTAITANGVSLTYRELDQRSNQVAHRLRAMGVGLDALVGIYVERSVDMMVALFGILKAGGAYVPLDPDYPADRIAFMVSDAQLGIIVTQQALTERVPASDAELVAVDDYASGKATEPTTAVPLEVTPSNLAYAIYTSGSTGTPKGVLVEHRNVVNFFSGMDERIGPEPGVWLAVTSLSFDISVLELFWTLSRGFSVVIHTGEVAPAPAAPRASSRPIDFSLFYFSSDESERGQDKYRLLTEGAKFADSNGFSAVWTPERHFHAFGGLYPNAAVTSAALATITENVQLRAGSCVIPLHHPVRVAEEWSVVDNLSGGRVGISFAAGWQPNDFLLRPQSYPDNKEVMLRDLEVVRRLWRGETIAFPGALGDDVPVRILPRPIQSELPFWLTAAGNPETFRAAGRVGANLLTHLLGQSVDELADKIAIYRQAWEEAGHPGRGVVSLMLHTFVGPDEDAVREIVRKPMVEYLRSSVNLIKQFAWSFPAFKNVNPGDDVDLQALSAEDMDGLLAFAFERYYETSGLFGTPESCVAMVERIKDVGVDDCACLIDFGVDSETVLAHLPHLDQLRRYTQPGPEVDAQAHPVAQLIARHEVTHMQCTPSMATMLLTDNSARPAFRALNKLMIGGEAFPSSLAQQLAEATEATIINMYGPTETTIWSSTHQLDGRTPIPIGRPIANTKLYVVDRHGALTPRGVPGELWIGGDGVVRGYKDRPELTAERFVADPFGAPEDRAYRTGDLVRWSADGVMEFLGRIDHQVKLRGYRIELGEIEATLTKHPAVREAVCIVREDAPGDRRLVAYLIEESAVAVGDLRTHLRVTLPDYMVPAQFVSLDRFPLTPNAKIDRKALPAPESVKRAAPQAAFSAPAEGIEEQIATVWRDLLRLEQVGVMDNFFDLGGDSLLAVQSLQRLREDLSKPIAITDLFRFPTIRALARHLGGEEKSKSSDQGADRAAKRRAAMANRRANRRGRSASVRRI